MGFPRSVVRSRIALRIDTAPDEDGRASGGAFRKNLQLLRRLYPAVPRAGECRHDGRADACDGYSASVLKLRRLVAGGVYDTCIYRHSPRRITEKWIDARQVTDDLTEFVGNDAKSGA